jgi:hypothetical protein
MDHDGLTAAERYPTLSQLAALSMQLLAHSYSRRKKAMSKENNAQLRVRIEKRQQVRTKKGNGKKEKKKKIGSEK